MVRVEPRCHRRSPRVVSPWRPGLDSLAWSALVACDLAPDLDRRSTAFVLPLSFVALTCTIALGSSDQTQEPPTEMVRSTLTTVFRILEDKKLKDPAKLIPCRHMLEEVIASHFDYTEMSKRALAAHWVPLTAGERA